MNTTALSLAFLTMGCFLQLSATATQPSISSVIDGILIGYNSFSSGYVKYDVYNDGVRTLTIEEAIVRDQNYFDRVVHWYSQDLYHFDEERFDPLLNSYYWSKAARVRFHETTRTASVSEGTRQFLPTVSASRYFGYLGILTPERTVDLNGTIPSIGKSEFDITKFTVGHYGVTDYYFPWALSDKSQWRLTPDTEHHNWVILTRDTKHVAELLVVDLDRGCAIVRRQIDEPKLGTGHLLDCSDFEQLTTDLWLPRRIGLSTKSGDSSMQIVVRKLSNAVPSEYLTPNLQQPGYIVHQSNMPTVIVGRGEDLLDFTLERIQRFLKNQDHAGQDCTAWWVLWPLAICVQLAMIWRLNRTAAKKFHS